MYILVINIWNVSIINKQVRIHLKKVQILNNPSVSGYLQVALRKPCYSKMHLGLLEGPFVKQTLQKWDIFSHLKISRCHYSCYTIMKKKDMTEC